VLPGPSAAPVLLDPDCAGVPEWAEATLARFDRIDELQIEGVEASGPELMSFLATASGQIAGIAARQEAGPVPGLAAEANALAIKAYGIIEESADVQYEGLSEADGVAVTKGLRLFDDGMDLVNDARKEIGRLMGRCSPEG
jgi:hypothetical protein